MDNYETWEIHKREPIPDALAEELKYWDVTHHEDGTVTLKCIEHLAD